jgi:hypothetical protein
MIHLTDGILLVLEYGLAVFCFVEIVRSPEAAVPWMPRWGWIVAVLLFPLAGSIGWLVAGHQRRLKVRSGTPVAVDEETSLEQAAAAVHQPRTGRFGSLEDDAALLAQLWEVNEEHERTLRRWEEDLSRREEALRQRLGREQGTRRLSDAA